MALVFVAPRVGSAPSAPRLPPCSSQTSGCLAENKRSSVPRARVKLRPTPSLIQMVMKLLAMLFGAGAGAGSSAATADHPMAPPSPPSWPPSSPPSQPPFQCPDLTLKAKGWQMISFHCAGTYIEYRTLDDIMEGVPFATDDKILTRDPQEGLVFATYSGTKWVGALVKRGLSYKNGYKVLFTGPEDSVITQIGSPWSRQFVWDDSVNGWVDPAVVVLSKGWNWIGHRIDVSVNINSNITVTSGQFSYDDQFKTRSLGTVATANYDGSKFQGLLTELEPGLGYMVKVKEPVTFKYNLPWKPASPPPPRPAPLPAPPQPPTNGCPNTCLGAGPEYANDGECDDGGPGAAHSICAFGAHCAGSHPSPQPGRTALILRVRALPQLQ